MTMADGSPGPAFCSACGQSLNPSSRFCASCGAEVVRSGAVIPPPAAPPPKGRTRNRHWGVVLTLESILCAGLTVLFVAVGAPPIIVGIVGIAALLFVVALVLLLLTRIARRSASRRAGQAAAPVPGTPGAPPPATFIQPKRKGKVGYWLLLIVIAAALGYSAWRFLHWYEIIAIACVGLALAAVTWLNPRGIGSTVTRVFSTLKLPGLQPGSSSRKAAILLALDLALLPAAVGAGSAYVNVFAPSYFQLDGFAVVASPLTGATVTAYQLTSSGTAGVTLGAATTDKDGHYALTVLPAQRTRVLVITTGGTYVDQVTNKPVAAVAGDSLRSILLSQSGQMSLTPLSTFATARTAALAASGENLDVSVAASFTGVAQMFGLPDVSQTYPSVATVAPEQQAAISTLAARQLGTILSGLDVAANALGTSAFALTDAMAGDISDGRFDGKKGKTTLRVNRGSGVVLPGTPIVLIDGVKQFQKSPANRLPPGTPSPIIDIQPIGVGLNTGGLDFISTTSLPAWRSDTQGQATIHGSGGVQPYHCSLAGGALPPGFTLSNDCLLSGRGVKTTNTSISAGFTVRMTDSSHTGHYATVDLNVTTTPFPPVVRINGGECPGPNQPCKLMGFATATGGSPPYFYQKAVMGEFPPLGMVLWEDGSVRGTPRQAGPSKNFSVCAVDIGGAFGCTNASFTTRAPLANSPAPSAAPAATWYLHFNCQGVRACEQYTSAQNFNGSGGVGDVIDRNPPAQCPSDASNGAREVGGTWWCSQSSNPGDTGP